MTAEMLATVIRQQIASQGNGVLNLWTVYDEPQGYSARCFELDKPTDVVIKGDLDAIRSALERCGLVPLMRDESDAPEIMETWV